jgi:hypothetical protein
VNQLLLLGQSSSFLTICGRQWTGIGQQGDGLDVEISSSWNMYFGGFLQVGPTEVTIERDSSIACRLNANLFDRCEILHTIGEEIGMGVPENEGAKLHDRDKTGEILDLRIWISSIQYTR